MESCVNDVVVDHVFNTNHLVMDNQWAYRRKGRCTELLLAHLTETWRHAVDSGLVVGVALIDFKGRFTRYDFVACDKLTTSLRREFFRVNQTYNSLTTVVYVTKNVVGF